MGHRRKRKSNRIDSIRAPAKEQRWPRDALAWAAGLSLVAMTVVAYLPATECGFVWDDDVYVEHNDTLRDLSGLRRIWLELGAIPHQYFPMVHTTFWLEYHLWGLDPTGYHVVNILLHAASAVLLWRVLRLLQVPLAWAIAAAFAVHPVHVESVAWITERKNVLSGLFYLGSALAYLRCGLAPPDASSGGRSWAPYAVSLVLYLLALLSKSVTCSLPAVLLLILWWKRRPFDRRTLLGLVPFFVFGLALGMLSAWMERHHVGAVGTEWGYSPVERCLIAGRALWFYASKLVWPHPLVFIYPQWAIDAGAWVQYVYPAGVIGVLAALWFGRCRLGRGPVVAALYFAGTLFPALGFFEVYFMRYAFVQDHFQYLASVGVIGLVIVAVHRVVRRAGRPSQVLAATCLAGVLVVFAGATWRQTHAYRDRETLWRTTLNRNPNAWMAHTNLGGVLMGQGKPAEAIPHFREGIRLKPDYAKAHSNLCVALGMLGKYNEALDQCREALRIEPGSGEARSNLAKVLAGMGRLTEAVEQYRLALEALPDDAKIHYNLSHALQRLGRSEEARRARAEAARLDPRRYGPPPTGR